MSDAIRKYERKGVLSPNAPLGNPRRVFADDDFDGKGVGRRLIGARTAD